MATPILRSAERRYRCDDTQLFAIRLVTLLTEDAPSARVEGPSAGWVSDADSLHSAAFEAMANPLGGRGVTVLDLVIRGGSVVDGNGTPARVADVGVSGGVIVAVGRVSERARRVVDASGLVVTPGFVDVHVHYDAQIHWDPMLTPSCFHGVTTVMGGNCGYSVAPLRAGDAFVAEMLARVEGMPLEALEAGVPWSWSSFGDWLDGLEGRTGLNVAFMVGHSTIRRAVMGDAAGDAHPTHDQVRAMAELVDASIAGGALGFSSSWSGVHLDGQGEAVPSRRAGLDELLALCEVVRRHPGASVEFVPTSGESWDGVAETLIRMSLTAGRSVNWNTLRVDNAPKDRIRLRERLQMSVEAQRRGASVVALTHPEAASTRDSLAHSSNFRRLPGWAEVMRLPLPERAAALRDPQTRRRLRAAEEARPSLPWPLDSYTEWGALRVVESPRAAPGAEVRTVGEIAAERRIDPFDAMLDIAVEDDLVTRFSPTGHGDDDDAWRLRAELWTDPHTVVGASDAGAHLDSMCGASYTTTVLAEGVRERQLLTLEAAVRQLTQVPAGLYGLQHRGSITEGNHADLVVLDLDELAVGPLVERDDLPNGASRLVCDATGYHHVFVNGVEVVRGNELTGATPGAVLRSSQDFVSPAIAAG
jgi:N-acyl-D-aspartate/D-glutamate deacylase